MRLAAKARAAATGPEILPTQNRNDLIVLTVLARAFCNEASPWFDDLRGSVGKTGLIWR